jgi:predicted transposase YdaD
LKCLSREIVWYLKIHRERERGEEGGREREREKGRNVLWF